MTCRSRIASHPPFLGNGKTHETVLGIVYCTSALKENQAVQRFLMANYYLFFLKHFASHLKPDFGSHHKLVN